VVNRVISGLEDQSSALEGWLNPSFPAPSVMCIDS
jgi:hypothetical protein